MRALFYSVAGLMVFPGCAELDRAGEAVLSEVRSINESGEASYEALGGPPPERGETIER